MASNKFEEKKYYAEVLGELYEDVVRIERGLHSDWGVIGKSDVQATDWRTKELLWEDEEHTIPKYEDKYGNRDIADDELSETSLMKIRVCKKIMDSLEKML